MSENKIIVTVEATAHHDDESGKWQAVVIERYSTSTDIVEHRSSELFETHGLAMDKALEASKQIAEHNQRVINNELSKMQDWLKLPHEERVRRAKASFPVGSPFESSSDNG